MMPDEPGASAAPQVTDWRAGGYGNFGLVVIERLEDGSYRIGRIISPHEVQAYADAHRVEDS